MMIRISGLSLAFVLLLVLSGCTAQNPASSATTVNPGSSNPSLNSGVISASTTGSVKDAGPLSWLLRAVPADNIKYLGYSDIPALSSYQGQPIPSHQASVRERIDWWTTIEREVLSGTSFPTIIEVWGFDAVDIKGSLTVWYQDQTSLDIFIGNFDIPAFREKLESYQYQEESYLGYPVFTGVPPAAVDISPPLPAWFPRACGIIGDVEISGDKISFIILANTPENDKQKAENILQTALKAYQDKTALAYRSGGITDLANSLGRVGSAFIREDFSFELDLQHMPAAEREKFTGPGELSPYERLAITYRKEGNEPIVEFILAYETNAIAESNIDTLQKRLNEGGSFTNKPLSEFWTVKDVKANGLFLVGAVELLEQASGRTISFGVMVFGGDYFFLAPN